MRDDPGGTFDSNEHRRVLGHLGHPRSLFSLRTVLKTDTDASGLDESEVVEIVKDLEASGFAKNIGEHEDGASVVKACADDDALPTLHQTKAKAFKERAERLPDKYLDGELWALTQRGIDALNDDLNDEGDE